MNKQVYINGSYGSPFPTLASSKRHLRCNGLMHGDFVACPLESIIGYTDLCVWYRDKYIISQGAEMIFSLREYNLAILVAAGEKTINDANFSFRETNDPLIVSTLNITLEYGLRQSWTRLSTPLNYLQISHDGSRKPIETIQVDVDVPSDLLPGALILDNLQVTTVITLIQNGALYGPPLDVIYYAFRQAKWVNTLPEPFIMRDYEGSLEYDQVVLDTGALFFHSTTTTIGPVELIDGCEIIILRGEVLMNNGMSLNRYLEISCPENAPNTLDVKTPNGDYQLTVKPKLLSPVPGFSQFNGRYLRCLKVSHYYLARYDCDLATAWNRLSPLTEHMEINIGDDNYNKWFVVDCDDAIVAERYDLPCGMNRNLPAEVKLIYSRSQVNSYLDDMNLNTIEHIQIIANNGEELILPCYY